MLTIDSSASQEQKNRLKVRWARLSILSNTLLVAFKLAVGILGQSVSIIAEAVHSLNDLLAAVITFGAVRKSSQPPDSDHQFGHGKYENLSGLVESALIVAAGGMIIYQAVQKIRHPSEIGFLWLGIAVMGTSALVNLFVSRILLRVARQTDSIAIETDGAHLLVDVYTSLGVMAGLVAIKLTGLLILDPILSICIALYIVYLGIHLSIRSGKDLLDEQLPTEEIDTIQAIIGDYAHGICSFHKLATRKAGGQRMIDVHIEVHGTESVKAAHDLVTHIEQDLQAKYPGARIMIHVEPCNETCQTCNHPSCPDRK
jgi:cation diffusion facilitator family transporter